MSRYAISGVTDTLLDASIDGTGATVGDPSSLFAGRNLLGENLPTGRIFWLRSVWAYNVSAISTLVLFDATAGSNATISTQKMFVRSASIQTTMVDIPPPGLKFKTGCVVARLDSAASAAFQAGYVGGAGYYE